MRRLLLLPMVAAATSAAILARADNPTYVLGIPAAPTMYLSNDAGDNPWLAVNANFAAMSISATTGGVSRVEQLDEPQLALASAEAVGLAQVFELDQVHGTGWVEKLNGLTNKRTNE